jgi:BlaI family penicillinase repressor
MNTSHQLGGLQLEIMRVLWKEGEASVARVHEALHASGGRALTTIATMLTKMEKKGVVEHRSEGRQFLYRATVSESEVQRSMVADLAERLFAGDLAALVSHLIAEQAPEPAEVERLKRVIAKAARAAQSNEETEPRTSTEAKNSAVSEPEARSNEEGGRRRAR